MMDSATYPVNSHPAEASRKEDEPCPPMERRFDISYDRIGNQSRRRRSFGMVDFGRNLLRGSIEILRLTHDRKGRRVSISISRWEKKKQKGRKMV